MSGVRPKKKPKMYACSRARRVSYDGMHAAAAATTRHDVVQDDQRRREHKPDEALHDVADEAHALQHDDEQDHVRPRKLAKLIHVLLLLQAQRGEVTRQLGSVAAREAQAWARALSERTNMTKPTQYSP